MQKHALDKSCTEYLACLFIKTSNNGRYRVMKTSLDNTYIMGKYYYPKEDGIDANVNV